VNDLRSLLPGLADAIERLVDERVATALSENSTDSRSAWLSLSAAAKYVYVSERTLARMIACGRIRRRLVHREDLDDFLRAAAGRE
jgi:excisionase family DNA binding protein